MTKLCLDMNESSTTN